MGLRCLLGHDFTEPEIERDREEGGKEVVTTVREVKTCRRCGEAQIVSENTEVTTIEQLTDQATSADPAAGGDPESGAATIGTADADAAGTADAETIGTAEGGAPDTSPQSNDSARRSGPNTGALDDAEDDAEILDDGPTGTPGTGATDATAAGPASGSSDAVEAAGPAADTDADIAEEDAEILDAGDADETEGSGSTGDRGEPGPTADADREPVETAGSTGDGERNRGAWPAVDEVTAESGPEPSEWPEHRGEDEGFSAEVGGDGDGGGGVEFGGGLTPESADPPADAGPETEYVEAPDRTDGTAADPTGADPTTAASDDDGAVAADTASGITRDETPEFEHMTSSAPTEYYCPECGMTEHAGGNSMRAGDVCPECKGGYVAERRR